MVLTFDFDMIIVVYLVSPWQTFHRRPMLEALARQAVGRAAILCVNPVLSLRQLCSPSLQRYCKAGWLSPQRLSENLYLFTPVVWLPKGGRRWQNKKSSAWQMISAQVRDLARKIAPGAGKIISWIYRPQQLSCLGLAGENLIVYECYDKYCLSHIDGQEVFGIKELEDDLLKKADLVFTTGQGLYGFLMEKHPHVYYAPNGANFEVFSAAQNRGLSIAADLVKIPSPRIGYTGSLTGRVDFELLEKIAGHNNSWSLVIVGPVAAEVKIKVQELAQQANVYYLGPRPYELIPQYLKELDVCIIPYKMHKWNDYSSPLKLWEYLAAGKPVVSTPAKETEGLKELIWFAQGHGAFIDAIKDVLKSDVRDRTQCGKKLAQQHSWDKLTYKMFETIRESFDE